MATQLKRDMKERKDSYVVYTADGARGLIYFSKSLFGETKAPDTITVEGVSFAPAGSVVQKSKMTPEERKAAAKKAAEDRKNMTPQQKAQAAKEAADKAAARAKKLAEAAAKAAAA
jgi:acyl-CoA reductase-like NAD-dependent aldehyde dehydrogenase